MEAEPSSRAFRDASRRHLHRVVAVAVALAVVVVAVADLVVGGPRAPFQTSFLVLLAGAVAAAAVQIYSVASVRDGRASDRALQRSWGDRDRITARLLRHVSVLGGDSLDELWAHTCRLGRDLFDAEAVSYWQIDGDSCQLVARDPWGSWQPGARIPLEALHPSTGSAAGRGMEPVVLATYGGSPHGTSARAATEDVWTPVLVGGRPVGFIGLTLPEVSSPSQGWFSALDRFADQVAVAKTGVRRREALLEAREHALQLQAGLLPALPPGSPVVDVELLYRPGLSGLLLGGDFVDVVHEDDGCVSFILGDVCGHGPRAAALGATLRAAWSGMVAIGSRDVAAWAAALHSMVLSRRTEGLFVTAVAGRIDPIARTLDYVGAGHPPPVVWSGAPRLLPVGGLPLGIDLPGPGYVRHTIDLDPVWAVLCFTDGLFERRAPVPADGVEGIDALVAHVTASAGVWTPGYLDRLADRCLLTHEPLADDVAALLLASPRSV